MDFVIAVAFCYTAFIFCNKKTNAPCNKMVVIFFDNGNIFLIFSDKVSNLIKY